MTTRIISLLVPAYIKPVHAGQTPVSYGQKVVVKFDDALAKLSPFVLKSGASQFVIDPIYGRQTEARVRYDVQAKMDDTLAEIIALALASFNVPSITVIEGTRVEQFDQDAIEQVAAGLHPWLED